MEMCTSHFLPEAGFQADGHAIQLAGDFVVAIYPADDRRLIPSPVPSARARCGSRNQGVAEEQALKVGMEEKAREFVEKGAEIYAKA